MYSDEELTPEALRADLEDLRDRARIIDELTILKDDLQLEHMAELKDRLDVIEEVRVHPRLNEKLWFGWTRWTWMVISYVFVGIVMFIAVTLAVQTNEDVDEEQRERAEQRCEVLAESRDGVRALLFALIRPEEGEVLGPERQARYNEIVKLADETLPPLTCTPDEIIREGG